MEIGRNRLRKHNDRRIAVALFQVAENLVVGAVFFHDIDDVLDLLPQLGEQLRAFVRLCRAEVVVLGHLLSQVLKLVPFGNGQREKSGFGALPYVLVGRIAGSV